MPVVTFEYFTGVRMELVRHARLHGSWTPEGRAAEAWSERPMERFLGEDGCCAFRAQVAFDPAEVGRELRWGVMLDTLHAERVWGIATEVNHPGDAARHRSFVLGPSDDVQRYHLGFGRRLGAQKHHLPGERAPALRFAVWAPNARQVEVVFGLGDTGYIGDDGTGIDLAMPVIPLGRQSGGVWESDLTRTPSLRRFTDCERRPYMFRVVRDDGSVVYRSDPYSRCQVGIGAVNPSGGPYQGSYRELDGLVSCSMVVDPDAVIATFREPDPRDRGHIPAEDFWADEFVPERPLPTRIEDLVIYELHVGALGYGKGRQGRLEDAMDPRFLAYLEGLGVSAVELLPMAEFQGSANWGYGNSHQLAVDCSAGGRDQLKHFVRACHRRGIAVLMDVVYNHYTLDAERSLWCYDSPAHERNLYYWYEGRPGDYGAYEIAAGRDPGRDPPGHGGYLVNGSSGYAPRYHEEVVRQLFISSAVTLVDEFHVDGFRVDLVNAIHRDNTRRGDGAPVAAANQFGAKLLREWARTLRLLRPSILLIAEDHSGWPAVTAPLAAGGLGFDATWDASFYHELVGDSRWSQDERARLLLRAGRGGDEPLGLDRFARALAASGCGRVVYPESHDEAGNSPGSRRNIRVAVSDAPLVGATRRVAEARCRLSFGLSLLSAGTPMFFMGEEVAAQKDYTYERFLCDREDLLGEREREGARMYRFYQELIGLRRTTGALRSRALAVVHVDNAARVLAFVRRGDGAECLVVASFNNRPFSRGYGFGHAELGGGGWREVFNSDAAVYGGDDVGNCGATLVPCDGWLAPVLPASGFVVLQRA